MGITVPTLNGAHPGPLYYISGAKDFTLYRMHEGLGTLKLEKDCEFLRAWQLDLDSDDINDLLVESKCENKHLKYGFYDLKFNRLYPDVLFIPTLTILNYEEFEVITQKGALPVFRFLNVGLIPPSASPWETNLISKMNHLYELRAIFSDGKWKFELAVLENPNEWVKSLGLRYLPSYRVLHSLNGKILIQLMGKTAWVDIKTQKASWANLDDMLLLGSQKQPLYGTTDSVLQSFITPYEYRGYIFNGLKLRFKQGNRLDPLIDILGTLKNAQGYLTVVRSFQNLIYLQYNEAGLLVATTKTQVDRFDFLTAQDLIASVINLPFKGRMIQVVDGTKVNSQYLDLMDEFDKKSFEVPSNCVTQRPVVIENELFMPLFCAKTKHEFEMRFINL